MIIRLSLTLGLKTRLSFQNCIQELLRLFQSLLMQFMLVARAHGYDTNPMAGFEADQLAKAFDLDEERLLQS